METGSKISQIDIRIGKLLVGHGIISEEQLRLAMEKQEENTNLRIPSMIGEICVEEGWCNMADIAAIMREQKNEVIRANTLGKCLLEQNFITREKLLEALEEHEEIFAPLGEIVVDKGFCTEDQVRLALYLQEKRRTAISRRMVSSVFEPVNILELVINDEIDGLIAEHGGCYCAQCRSNVFAITLNKLPPRYASNQNLISTLIDRFKEEYSDLVREHIISGISKVKENPKLSCRMKNRKMADSFDVAGEVLVKVSNRHVHLSERDVSALFEEGHSLTRWKDLLQPGQFAAKEVVTLVGPKGKIENVRVLGPCRPETQMEISGTDQFILGIQVPVKQSGDIEGSPGIVLAGPKGRVELEKGIIRAFRHIHMTPFDAKNFHVRDNSLVNVRLMGDRSTVCEDVLVRISESAFLEMHVDTDEANAAGIPAESSGVILKERLGP